MSTTRTIGLIALFGASIGMAVVSRDAETGDESSLQVSQSFVTTLTSDVREVPGTSVRAEANRPDPANKAGRMAIPEFLSKELERLGTPERNFESSLSNVLNSIGVDADLAADVAVVISSHHRRYLDLKDTISYRMNGILVTPRSEEMNRIRVVMSWELVDLGLTKDQVKKLVRELRSEFGEYGMRAIKTTADPKVRFTAIDN